MRKGDYMSHHNNYVKRKSQPFDLPRQKAGAGLSA
jgi:hypothetical protein